MASAWVYFQADGSRGPRPTGTHQAARAMASPGSLFVYGGDVYMEGTHAEFAEFDGVYAGALPYLAAIPGNHDWETGDAAGYDRYWLARQPPASCTSINIDKTGPSRNHYRLELGNGWLGVFIDCGKDAKTRLTGGALSRFDEWLAAHGSRRVIVFLHHARLSRGKHSNNWRFDPLWQKGFDAAGRPRIAAWVAGHNHNMGIYSPRSAGTGEGADPPPSPNGSADGVQIFVNGAGGEGFYLHNPELPEIAKGTMPDVFGNDKNFGFLRIELTDRNTAVFQNFSTGGSGTANPTPIGPTVAIEV